MSKKDAGALNCSPMEKNGLQLCSNKCGRFSKKSSEGSKDAGGVLCQVDKDKSVEVKSARVCGPFYEKRELEHKEAISQRDGTIQDLRVEQEAIQSSLESVTQKLEGTRKERDDYAKLIVKEKGEVNRLKKEVDAKAKKIESMEGEISQCDMNAQDAWRRLKDLQEVSNNWNSHQKKMDAARKEVEKHQRRVEELLVLGEENKVLMAEIKNLETKNNALTGRVREMEQNFAAIQSAVTSEPEPEAEVES